MNDLKKIVRCLNETSEILDTLNLSQETGKKLHISKMLETLHDTLNFSQRNRKETLYFLRC